MNLEIIIKITVLIVLLILSAFFSGSETALFSLNSLEKDKLKRQSKEKHSKYINLFLSRPERILVTILTGNMIVNVFATTIYNDLWIKLAFFKSEIISISIMTLLLLIIGEITPKNIAFRKSLSFSRFSVKWLRLFDFLFKPICLVLDRIRKALTIKIRTQHNEKDIILSTVKIGLKQGIINQAQEKVFESFFDFREMIAADVMIPRTRIQGIDVATKIQDLLSNLQGSEQNQSYLLVYNKKIDSPLGYIDIKDLLGFKLGMDKKLPLKKIIHPFYSVPQTKKLTELLLDMKIQNIAMALVIDEYGGTAGIISFNSLVQIILDYFYPSATEEKIREMGKGCYIIKGDMEIKTLNQELNLNLESESRTVAGMIMERAEEIPVQGYKVNIAGTGFTVKKIIKNRIEQIEVKTNQNI